MSELNAVAAVLAGVAVEDLMVARPDGAGGLVVVVQPGRKYVYSAAQVAAALRATTTAHMLAAMGALGAPSAPSQNGTAPTPAPTPAPGGQARKVGKLGATARKGPKV